MPKKRKYTRRTIPYEVVTPTSPRPVAVRSRRLQDSLARARQVRADAEQSLAHAIEHERLLENLVADVEGLNL